MKGGASIWNPWVLIPAGVLTLLFGVWIRVRDIVRGKRYKGRVEGRILSVKKIRKIGGSGGSRHLYIPLVEYIVDGMRYEVEGQAYTREDFYVLGAELPIFYRLEKPEKCLTVPPDDSKELLRIFFYAGLGLALLGALAAVF